MPRKALIALPALLLAAATPLVAQQVPEDDGPTPGEFAFAAERILPPALADGRFFTVYNLSLIVGQAGDDGPELNVFSLAGEMKSDELQRIETTGIPGNFRLEAMEAHLFTRSLLLAGTRRGAPAIWRGTMGPRATVGSWTALPAPPAVEGFRRFVSIHSDGEHAIFMYERDGADGGVPQVAGWAANVGAGAEQFDWIEVPPADVRREGAAVASVPGLVVMAGGVERDSEGRTRTARIPRSVAFDKPNFGPWKELFNPLPVGYDDVVAVGYGAAMYLAPRRPLEGEDAPTSQTVHLSTSQLGGTMSLWRPMRLREEPANIRDLVADPGHGWLLVISEAEEGLRLGAYAVPQDFMSRRPTEEDELLDRLERMAGRFPAIPPAEAQRTAREEEKHVLFVIRSADRETDLRLRAALSTTNWRYMTAGCVISYLDASQAASVLSASGVSQLPALVLTDGTGRPLATHSGSIPTVAQLLQVTAPTRAAAGDPQSNQETGP